MVKSDIISCAVSAEVIMLTKVEAQKASYPFRI